MLFAIITLQNISWVNFFTEAEMADPVYSAGVEEPGDARPRARRACRVLPPACHAGWFSPPLSVFEKSIGIVIFLCGTTAPRRRLDVVAARL